MRRAGENERLEAAAVARLLVELGQRVELAGGNPHRVRAYYRAAEGLEALPVPLEQVIAEGRLREIPGIGETLAEIIVKLAETGTHPALERMRAEIPSSLLAMLGVPGLTPKRIARAYRDLGITTLEALEAAARAGRLVEAKGFGPAVQATLLQGIDMLRTSQGRHLLHQAEGLLGSAIHDLKRTRPDLTRLEPAGDFRRGCELVSHLAIVAEATRPGGAGNTQFEGGIALHVAERGRHGAALLFATGSAEHIEDLEAAARSRGLVLDREGLRRGCAVVASRTERDIYAALGLQFIEPELREGRGEVSRAASRTLPELVRDSDLRGVLHCHTDFSDGANTLEEMADAARRRGYAYFGVADHSKTAAYAGGLKIADVAVQHALVDSLNSRFGPDFRILKGIESDILPDGSLDYPADVLSEFDFVVASVHSRFQLDREAQTARILRAVSNPFTTILGHMTGRVLLRRPGYDLDIEAILEACAAHGVAIEINAHPNRLDLDWRWHRRALDFGCTFSINPDAHSIPELDLIRWGVVMARKGGLAREQVLNSMDLATLTRLLQERRRRAAAV